MPVDFSILLKSLQRKKLEYETALDAINQTFEDLGLGVSTIVGHGQGGIAEKAEIQRSGIRIKGELSFRGRDKAEEYFRLLDRDNDKFLSYEDVRGKFCPTSSCDVTVNRMVRSHRSLQQPGHVCSRRDLPVEVRRCYRCAVRVTDRTAS